MKNPIIVALDVPSEDAALDLARQLSGKVGAFKIGLELFTRCGPNIVRKIRETGGDVFLDLKFHDIPSTVAHAVRSAVDFDVQMLTIHTCGGLEMMKAAEEAALERAAKLGRPAPLVLGVTVLTSMDTNDLNRVGVEHDVARQVERLATLAVEAGLRGLVCSPLEIEMLRGILPHETQLVTPGIRPAGADIGDQKRILTPREAIEAGANWLVIGRPIRQPKQGSPAEAADAILASLADDDSAS
jgi:orotidine-5'-phosphate decarboxylase